MRVPIKRAGLSFGCGLLITVAVAWWCAGLRYPGAEVGIDFLPDDEARHLVELHLGQLLENVSVGRSIYEYSAGISTVRGGSGEPSDLDNYFELWDYGFPAQAMRGEFHGYGDVDGTWFWTLRALGAGTVDSSGRLRITPAIRLPLQPVWPGFAIDVVAYTAMSFILLGILRVLHRRVRCLRSRCPDCGYSIKHLPSSVCPECGVSLTTGPANDPGAIGDSIE